MEIRPTGSLSLTRSLGKTVNFDVSVGSASSTETATHGSIMQTKLSFAPEVRMPFSQTSFGGSSVATFTPKVTCQQLVKATTTRSCGQGIALGMDTISKDGLTNVIVGTSFNQMGGQSSTSIVFKVMNWRKGSCLRGAPSRDRNIRDSPVICAFSSCARC